jgi:hypothetical protein
VVHRLENLNVHSGRLGAVKGVTTEQVRVRETLDPEANGTVPHVGLSGLWNRVKVSVDDPIQIPREDPNDPVKLFEIKDALVR